MTTNNLPVTQEAIRAAIAFNKQTRSWAELLRAQDRAARDTVELAQVFQHAMKQAAEAERAEMQKAVDYYASLYAERCGQLAIAAEAEQEWRPIETFAEPTTLSSGDGVLVADQDGTVGEAYYRNYGDVDDGWWWANTSWGDYPSPSTPKPTHWQPLPEPPAIRTLPTEIEGEGR